MKLYSYVIPRDYGFAPNPYHNICTLATCKPIIRRTANKGDWIAAYGAANTLYQGKLVMIMKVQETCTFDEYWNDDRFIKKRPVFNRSMSDAYGDNIYHHVDGQWKQEISHHSNIDGSINYKNLNRDTKTDRVLISTEFFYFGNNAIDIPDEFNELVKHGRNHNVSKDEELINQFISYIYDAYECGIHGTPFSREIGKFANYGGE